MTTTPPYLLCLIAFLSLMSAAQAEESPADDSETRPWDWPHTVYAATDRIVIFGDGLVTYEDYSPPDDGYLDVAKERSLPRVDVQKSRKRSYRESDPPLTTIYNTLVGACTSRSRGGLLMRPSKRGSITQTMCRLLPRFNTLMAQR